MPDRMMTVADLVSIFWELVKMGIGGLVGYFIGFHKALKRNEKNSDGTNE